MIKHQPDVKLSEVENAIRSGNVSRQEGFAFILKHRLYKPLTLENYAQSIWNIGRRAFNKAANGYMNNFKHAPLVYFVRVGDFWKVGTSKCFHHRLVTIQISNPHPVDEVYVVRGCGVSEEREIHLQLAEYHFRGEWYALPEEIVSTIRKKDIFESWL